MKNLFVDISGSVNYFIEYWNLVEKVKNENTFSKIYLWDSQIKKSNLEELNQMIKQKKGYAGTNPELICQVLKKEKINDNIVIITDGDVNDNYVQKCDESLSDYKINNVECYIIGRRANMSVTCPFTRENTSNVYYNNLLSEETVNLNKSDYELLNILDTMDLSTFNLNYNKLEKLLIARNMGKNNVDNNTKERLIKLKYKLTKELSENSSLNYGGKIRNELLNNNINNALEYSKNMANECFNNIGMDVEKQLGYLISLCGNLTNLYSVNDIRTNRLGRVNDVDPETNTTVDIELNDLTSLPIECPILMDYDVPQIMIVDPYNTSAYESDSESDEGYDSYSKSYIPLLANLDKKVVEDIADCPLRIVNHLDVVEKLKPMIKQYIGTKVNKHIVRNPFTKEQLIGTIPLGNCQQHVKCGNHTLAKMFAKGKLLGNMNLYFAVIWYLIKTDHFEYLKDIKQQVTEHLIYRLMNSNTKASLCGLPQYTITKVPTDIALWFTVHSGLLNLPTDRDTFRYHLFNLNIMIDILKELKYPIDERIYNHSFRLQTLMTMLSMCKKDNTKFKNNIQCLYQNAIKINGYPINWIPIDGPASPEQTDSILNSFPSYFRKLSISELVGIAQMVDPNLSASKIELKSDWTSSDVNYKVNWKYGLNNYPNSYIAVCPNTMRPLYNINDKVWTDVVNSIYGCHDFSGMKHYMVLYLCYKKLPTIDTFLYYCYNKSKYDTLPYQSKQWFHEIEESHELLNNMTYDDVINKYNKSVSIKERIKMEV